MTAEGRSERWIELLSAWDDITLSKLPFGCGVCGAKLPKHSQGCPRLGSPDTHFTEATDEERLAFHLAQGGRAWLVMDVVF